MNQCLNILHYLKSQDVHSYIVDDHKISPPSRAFMKFSMNP